MDAQQGAGRGIVFPMPALLFPPPPPPPIQLSYYSYASPSSHHPTITNFPILLLTVLGILATSVLLLAYYIFVIRCCLNWHSSSSSSSSDVAGLISGRRGRDSASSRLPVNGATPAEARGLEESTIQALPTFRYRKTIKKSDSAPTSECAVCLSEFEEEERVRMLPSCLHAFHVDCIDTWLQGNANCPLCRAPITGHCILPTELQRSEEVVIQVKAAADDTRAQQQPTRTSVAATESESAGDTTSAQQASAENRRNNNAWRDVEISSKEDEWAALKKDRDVLPLRRSSSMGSVGADEVRLQIHNILQRNAQFQRDDSVSSSSSSNVV